MLGPDVVAQHSLSCSVGGVVGDIATVDVQICVPDLAAGSRRPCDIVCVLDVSGSMQLPAAIKATNEDIEAAGLDRLDLVKHAVKTVVATLQPQDRLALVTYSDQAETKMPLTHMDGRGAEFAKEALDKLKPDGATNLWAGLKMGLDISVQSQAGRAAASEGERSRHICLLTDGQPNEPPAEGHMAALESYLGLSPRASETVVSTFGFGYDLDSKLLLEIAKRLGGMYTFIPDSSFVGTAFVNWIGNAMSTMWQLTEFIVEPLGAASVLEFLGSQGQKNPRAAAGGGPPPQTMTLGATVFGQNRNASVRMQVGASAKTGSAPFARICIKGYPGGGRLPVEMVAEARIAGAGASGGVSMQEAMAAKERRLQQFRMRLCDAIDVAMANPQDGRPSDTGIRELIGEIRDAGLSGEKMAKCLLADMEGQIMEAISRCDYYERWGKHYLPSLARAHQLQQCSNFKDPGVQDYGGVMFRAIQDAADSAFLSLPAPIHPEDLELLELQRQFGGLRPGPMATVVPAAQSSGGVTATAGGGVGALQRRPLGGTGGALPALARPQTPVADMQQYHNSSNPCFAGDGLVQMAPTASSSTKRVSELAPGDVVLGGARVLCVVRTACANGRADLCEVSSSTRSSSSSSSSSVPPLRVTPWHPIAAATKQGWQFPINRGVLRRAAPCPEVFNFILEKEMEGEGDGERPHTMTINGVQCLTLAHGIEDDPVASHPFFGTEAVVVELQKMDGWIDGCVELKPGCVVRDPITGLACGLRQ